MTSPVKIWLAILHSRDPHQATSKLLFDLRMGRKPRTLLKGLSFDFGSASLRLSGYSWHSFIA